MTLRRQALLGDIGTYVAFAVIFLFFAGPLLWLVSLSIRNSSEIFVSDLRQRPDSLDYKFHVQFNGKVIDARYTGIVPDTFKNESEVVLKGQLHPDGFAVEPNGVMAKCPSKYNPHTPRTAGS